MSQGCPIMIKCPKCTGKCAYLNRMVEEREETKEAEGADQFIEIEAFVICEEDNEDGLTWKEVSDCIESHENDLSKLHTQIGFHIPTKKDFDRYDVAPVDGILFFDEWNSVHDFE